MTATESKRLAVRVGPAAARQLRAGHPWLFDGSITNDPDGHPGQVAVVFDRDRDFVAVGLWDPTSPIRVRVLAHGSPAAVDDAFFAAGVSAAVARRPTGDPDHSAWRLINGENDGFGGLVADEYGDGADRVIVVKVYTEAWTRWLAPIVEALVTERSPRAVVLRLGRNAAASRPSWTLAGEWADGSVIWGSLGGVPVWYRENGLRFSADPVRGQKTGAFLDQRDNRARVAQAVTAGDRVLDVFSCQGGFATNAAAAGAAAVTAIDQSASAIAVVQTHLEANGLGATGRRHIVGDAFAALDELAQAGQQFEVVVLDPPSFASRREHVNRALSSYRRLTAGGLAVLKPGGLLFQASCSARVTTDDFTDAVVAEAADHGRPLSDVETSGHAVDHPVIFPEGNYLKAVWGRA